MPPLPKTLPAKFDSRPNYHSIKSAYNRCLLAENYYTELAERPKSTADARLALICVRIVGYIIRHAPTETGVGTIVKEIHSCQDDVALRGVGDRHLAAWTRAFKAAKGKTPAPSNHASRPSFDTLADMINDTLETAPQSHASAKRSALARDGFRCMVTGKYDRISIKKNEELLALQLDYDDVTDTECAHIFSESTNFDIEPGSDKVSGVASSMWAVMSRFGYTPLPEDLNGANVHRLENILTLDGMVHKMFDSLEVWFVATDLEHWQERKHIYKVEVVPGEERLARKFPTVTFKSTRDDLPLPSPEYLAIHAACCNVAHLSGALEWFQEYEDELDKHLHKTLANNGTSAHFLHNALHVHALMGDTMA